MFIVLISSILHVCWDVHCNWSSCTDHFQGMFFHKTYTSFYSPRLFPFFYKLCVSYTCTDMFSMIGNLVIVMPPKFSTTVFTYQNIRHIVFLLVSIFHWLELDSEHLTHRVVDMFYNIFRQYGNFPMPFCPSSWHHTWDTSIPDNSVSLQILSSDHCGFWLVS